MKTAQLIAVAFLLTLASASAAEQGPRATEDLTIPATTRRADKIALRISNGLMFNRGDKKIVAASIAGINAGYWHFLSDRVAVGGGYSADIDFNRGLLTLSGFYGDVRWYPWGPGTRVNWARDGLESEIHPRWSYYTGAQISYTSYYFGPNPQNPTLSLAGGYGAVAALAGVEWRWSRQFELSAEANMGLSAFGHTDQLFRMQKLLLILGVTFLW